MDDMFDSFMQPSTNTSASAPLYNMGNSASLFDDPAADFLSSQEAEVRKIESIGEDFPSSAGNQFFEMSQPLDFNNNQVNILLENNININDFILYKF